MKQESDIKKAFDYASSSIVLGMLSIVIFRLDLWEITKAMGIAFIVGTFLKMVYETADWVIDWIFRDKENKF